MMSEDDDDGFVNEQLMGLMNSPMEKYFNINYSKEFMASLPEKIRQRTDVLLQYHEEFMALQKEKEEREVAIRRKYESLFAPAEHRRKEIITGTGAPVSDEEVKKGFPEDHAGKVSIEGDDGAEEAGIKNFWLEVLSHHVVLESMIQDHDAEVLEHLLNITSRIVDGGIGSLEVAFHFAPNDFFEEEVLTLTCIAGKDGETNIQRGPLTWKEGKDVTVETVTKKQRAKKTGQVRTITTQQPRESFFAIFKESAAEEDDEDEDDEDEDEDVLSLIQLLHNSIVPAAVNYYTGEAPDGSDDVEEEEEDEEEDDDDSEEDLPPQRMAGGRGMRGRGGRY